MNIPTAKEMSLQVSQEILDRVATGLRKNSKYEITTDEYARVGHFLRSKGYKITLDEFHTYTISLPVSEEEMHAEVFGNEPFVKIPHATKVQAKITQDIVDFVVRILHGNDVPYITESEHSLVGSILESSGYVLAFDWDTRTRYSVSLPKNEIIQYVDK